MRYLNKGALAALTIGLLASGAGAQQRSAGVPAVAPVGDATPPADLPGGAGPSGTSATTPARFDQVGYAVLDAHGSGITASGPGLPAGFAEVTDLASGRTVLVKTSDGAAPMPGTLVALSPATAQLLGLSGSAPAPVRVRQVEPIAADQVALEQGRPAAPRLEAPPVLLTGLRAQMAQVPAPGAAKPSLAPPPSAKPPVKTVSTKKPAPNTTKPGAPYPAPGAQTPTKPDTDAKAKTPVAAKPATPHPANQQPKPAAAGKYHVRVGAFASQANAKSLAGKLGGHVSPSGKYWLVELGPFADAAAAKTARDGAAKRGYGDARVITD